MKMSALLAKGVPQEIVRLWETGQGNSLLPLQATAVREGLFESGNLLIQAPTSSGKTFIGFPAAADPFNASDAYRDLVGGIFAGHPWNAGDEHAFVVDDPGHPITKSLPEAFRWKDEIYQYDTRYKPGTSACS